MANPQQSCSRDVALAAIAQARGQIGKTDEQSGQVDETPFKLEQDRNTLAHPSSKQSRSVQLGRGFSRGPLVRRSLICLLSVACIGVAAFAWPSLHGQAAPEPISTSSLSTEKERGPAQPNPSSAEAATKDAGLPQKSSQAQTILQRAALLAPTAPDVSQLIQTIARELANVEQGIDQLKTAQAQLARDNAEIANHLKASQELARPNTELAEDLKAAEAQIARDNADFSEQLRASHDQMAKLADQLKQSQEQVARLVASAQKQRPKTLASSPTPTPNMTRRSVPTRPSPQVGVPTVDEKHPAQQ